jgi:hypothetical protein
MAGESTMSSTMGPRCVSTCFRLKAFWESDMERAWRNSISALTEPMLVWKAERKVSTSLRTVSQFFALENRDEDGYGYGCL